MYTIRPITTEEIEDYLQLRFKEYQLVGKASSLEDVIFFNEDLCLRVGLFFNGSLVGGILLHPAGAGELDTLLNGTITGVYCEASRFFISEGHRTRKVRRLVFDYVWDWARAEGYRKMYINTTLKLAPLYRIELGFRALAGLEFCHPSYDYIPHIVMVRYDGEAR